jgi:threonine efflux protein
MATNYLLTVAGMWAIATISPGPNFLTIAQIAASKSRSAAVWAVCGTGLATVIWGFCGVAGVQAVFVAAPWAYLALKIGGAAYLVYSGGRMVVQSWKRTSTIGNPSDGARQMPRRRAFAIGMATGLANPRAATARLVTGSTDLPAACSSCWASNLQSKASSLKRKDWPYRFGRSSDWLKMNNPACEAVRREAEEDWGR